MKNIVCIPAIVCALGCVFVTPAVAQDKTKIGAESYRDDSAAADRNVFTSRAETLDKGELSLDAFNLFAFFNVSYGFTDDTQASLAVSPVAWILSAMDDTSSNIGFYNLAVKRVLARNARGTLSVSVDTQIVAGSDSDSFNAFLIGGPGVLYDFRVASSFRLHAALAIQSGALVGSSGGLSGAAVAPGVFLRPVVGADLQVVDWLAFVAEGGYLFGIPFDSENKTLRLNLPISVVARFHGDTHAFDAGVVAFTSPDTDDTIGSTSIVPLLNYTARF